MLKKHGVVTEGNNAEIVGKMYDEVMKRGRNLKLKKGAGENEEMDSSSKPLIEEADDDDPIAERRRIFGEESLSDEENKDSEGENPR